MALSFGSIKFLQTDHDGKLQEFLDEFQRTNETPFWGCEPVGVRSTNNIAKTDLANGVGLPVLNYPDHPPFRLNVLTFPQGAARWATFFGFTMDPAILASTGSGTLTLGALGCTMIVQQVRKITVPNNVLYLVVLVDQRYFWQQKETGALALTKGGSWSSLIGVCGSALGVSISAATVNSAYLYPEQTELERKYWSVPVFLDAIAASVGQRIVVDFSGNVYSHNATSIAPFAVNNISSGNLIAGGVVTGGTASPESKALPANIVTTFPHYSHKTRHCDGDVYAISISTGVGTAGNILAIHSSCVADYTTGGTDPDNLTKLNNLATQIATDYAAWRSTAYDLTFGCQFVWVPNGFDDRIEHYYGTTIDGKQVSQTRVVSMPYDFGTDSQLSQDNLDFIEKYQIGRLAGTVSAGGSGNVDLYDQDGTSLSMSVLAYDWFGNTDPATSTFTSGTKVDLEWHCQDDKWIFKVPGSSTDDTKIVTVTTGSLGVRTSVGTSCVYGGKISVLTAGTTTMCSGGWTNTSDIWITAIDGPRGDGSDDTVTTPQVISGSRYIAQRVGALTVSSVTRDLYAIKTQYQASAMFIRFTLTYALNTTDASQTATVSDSWFGPTPASSLSVYNLSDVSGGNYVFQGSVGDQGYATYNELDNKYYITTMKQSSAPADVKLIFIDNSNEPYMIASNGFCVWTGYIQTLGAFTTLCLDTQYSTGSSVWVFAVDSKYNDGSGNNVVTPGLKSGDRYIGFKMGTYTVSGVTRDLYAIRSGLTATARFIRFSLGATLAITTASVTANVQDFWDGPDPGATTTVYNNDSSNTGKYQFFGKNGAWGIAIWNDLFQAYYIVSMEPLALFIEGALSANLTTTSVSCTVTSYFQGVDPGSPQTVYDDNSWFTGASSGDTYRAVYDNIAAKYRFINLKRNNGLIFLTATLSGNLTTSTSSVSVGSVATLDGSTAPTVTTASNTLGLAGQTGDTVVLVQSNSSGSYMILNVQHHAINEVVDVTWSNPSLTKKYRSFASMYNDTSDNSSTILTGASCT